MQHLLRKWNEQIIRTHRKYDEWLSVYIKFDPNNDGSAVNWVISELVFLQNN